MIDQSEILRYFEFGHLPIRLQPISGMFRELAWQIEAVLPKGAEKSTALRKLLESKDAAVRAALDLPEGPVYHPQSPEPGDLIRASTAAFHTDAPNPGRKGWPTPPEAAGSWLDAHDPDPSLHPLPGPGGLHAGDTSEWRGALTEHPTPAQEDWPDDAEEDANR
jgi:hypothetical protein